MNTPIQSQTRASRRERGFALLVTVFVLILVGAIAISAIGHSGEEATSSARTRAAKRALFGADGGIQLAAARIAASPVVDDSFTVDLENGLTIESRTRSQTTPQKIAMYKEMALASEAPEANSVEWVMLIRLKATIESTT